MKRHFASKHDSRAYIERVQQSCGLTLDVPRAAQVEIIEPEDGIRFLVIDGRFTFVEIGDDPPLPYVTSAAVLSMIPSVFVDEGAVKFILKGADIMRPGVSRYDDWGDKDRLVAVRDQAKGRALAVGRTAIPSAEMAAAAKGVSVRNLHHAGDRAWEIYKKI